MGLKKLEKIVQIFKRADKQYLPVAVISKGSLPEGSVLVGTVNNIEALVKKEKPVAPALIVLGETVGRHPEFYAETEVLKTELLGNYEQS